MRETHRHPIRSEAVVDYMDRFEIVPGRRSGKICLVGLRITVADVLGYLAAGTTEDELLEDFPELQVEDVRACLAFARDRLMAIPMS